MERVWTRFALVIAMVFGFSQDAAAAGAIEIGGRTAVTANLSVTSLNPDKIGGTDIDIAILYVGTSLTRTTDDARWEYGAGVTIGALFIDAKGGGASGDSKFATYTPSAQLRINSNLMGSEENFLVYAGAVAGVTFFDSDALPDDELGAFGPKFGAEYYFTSNIAVQLEDVLLFDTEKGINNSLALGVKVVF